MTAENPAPEATGADGPSPAASLAASTAALWMEAAAATRRLAFRGPPAPGDPDPAHLAPAMGSLARALARDPFRLADSLVTLAGAHARLAGDGFARCLGVEREPVIAPPDNDLRFAAPAWRRPSFYNQVLQAWLLNARWLTDCVDGAAFDNAEMRQKARFGTRLFVDSLAPANFAPLNPEVVDATRRQGGQNLVEGARNWLRDVEAGDGRPRVSQVDESAFTVGESVATAPGKVIWRNDLFELIQYAPTTERVRAVPVLFVPPWINKFYILDLVPRKSMVQWLVARGYTVFLISWVNPDERHREVGLDDMVERGVVTAIDQVLAETGEESVNLVGYCIGGTLAATVLAHLAERGRQPVSSCTFFASQVDFSAAGDLAALTDRQTVDRLARQMRQRGFLPSRAMADSFNSLRPGDLLWNFVIRNYLLGLPPGAMDLLFWNADSTRMAARLHEEYLRDFYVENRLAAGTLQLRDRPLRLADIDLPSYHVVGEDDHIAPAASVFRGLRAMAGERRFVLAESGHIAGIINPPRARKYGYRVDGEAEAETVADWAATAERRRGSWWTDWNRWLGARSPRRVPARTPGAGLGTLDDAPGTYVRVRYRD